MIVYIPKTRHTEYAIAGEEFVKYYREISGKNLTVVYEDDGKSDVVTFGGVAVNPLIARLVLNGEIPAPKINAGTEEYVVKTYFVQGRKILLLAGGLGRSTLYALYRYLEVAYNCRWYWDGDIVPKNSVRDIFEPIDLEERPRFAYRGLRYFAHRGCKRFQAEMWDFEDWKKEIDYLVKRRQNMFMLRIGQDDLFQRAFPDSVSYPTEETMDELNFKDGQGFNDRRLFWSLEYRGELRKKVMKYAFDRGLMSPEDCGTMTHWYSRTPIEFLEKEKPTFFGEVRTGYNTDSGRVWDIREDRNFDFYTKLTETSVREYGKDEIFHTIGFAERLFSEDREANRRMKKYVYDRFLQYLKEEHPKSTVFIASWDIWLTYKATEAQEMFATFDKEQCVIFDYTSDTAISNNFTNWGIMGEFPYIFGSFLGYESQNDCMGYYHITEERLAVAKADSTCKGMILWPELAHSDTLMLEFTAVNSWLDEVVPVQSVIEKLCGERYFCENGYMLDIWKRFYSVLSLMHWSQNTKALQWRPQYYYSGYGRWYIPRLVAREEVDEFIWDFPYDRAIKAHDDAIYCLEKLAKIPENSLQDEFIRRDVVDIARTIIGRYAHVYLIAEAENIVACRKGENKEKFVRSFGNAVSELLQCLCEILSIHEDFSLAKTLRDIQKNKPIYAGFEETLKNNTCCLYCRQNIYETVKEIFIPENEVMQKLILEGAPTWKYDESLETKFKIESEKIFAKYQAKKLEDIDKEPKGDFIKALENALEVLKQNPL